MLKNSFIFTALTVIFISACATKKSEPKKMYTHKEFMNMTVCVGMSDTARHVATKKSEGTPIAQMKSFYANKEGSSLNLATVDKVYADKVPGVWEYSVSFFKECALNLANVPADRANFSAYCMQRSMIADVAHGHRVAGSSKQTAQQALSGFKGQTTLIIIDNVYASNKGRVQEKLDEWNLCMDPITAKQ